MRLLGQYQTFLFFLQKDFTRTKSTKTDISEQKQKRQRFKCAYKTSKGRKVACSPICVFMLFMCFLCFLCFLCMWNLFVKKKNKKVWNCLNDLIYITTQTFFFLGFIKSTDHRPDQPTTKHLPSDPPTTNPMTDWTNNYIWKTWQ